MNGGEGAKGCACQLRGGGEGGGQGGRQQTMPITRQALKQQSTAGGGQAGEVRGVKEVGKGTLTPRIESGLDGGANAAARAAGE